MLYALLLALAVQPPPTDDEPAEQVMARFPPVSAVKAALDFSCIHRMSLQERIAFGGYEGDVLYDWLRQAQWCYRCWDALDDVQIAANCSNAAWGREKAAVLRKLLGDEAYYAGQMPPCVPVWRFSWR